MGKSVLVILMGFLIIFNITAGNINKTSKESEIVLYNNYGKTLAKDIAQSGANVILSKLVYYPFWRSEKSNISFAAGIFTAGAVNDTALGAYGIKVYSYSNFNGSLDTVFVRLRYESYRPVQVRASITANTEVDISGTITIDGRDHDEFGNLIPSSGTFGISTTSEFEQHGSAQVGGTTDSTDYVPSDPANPSIIEESAAWPNGFPDTPDKIMGGDSAGYPEGTLKSIAQSGFNGSQYVTDPSSLTFPLSGVTYVEIGWGQTWQSMDFGNSSGILVVHNSSTNSVIKTLNSGTFKGLLIADDVDKIHCDILGAVVVLTSSPPSGNVIGNGNGSVKYSSALVSQATTGMPGVRCSLNIAQWID